MITLCKSEKATLKLGAALADKLSGGEVILLGGDLGAGKTTLTKGIAQGLGIAQTVLSPTFTIMNEYEGAKLKLCHFDAYRLANGAEAVFAGVAESLGADDTVCVIEWYQNIADILPENKLIKVNIKYISDNTREVVIE